MNKSSIFTRIMLAGILPVVLIFSFVLTLISNMVYTISADSETEKALLRGEQATQFLSSRLLSMPSLLNLTSDLILNIDRTSPDAGQSAEDILVMFLSAHQDIYNAWFVFEPGVFREDARFAKSYIRDENGIREVFDMSGDVLDDPGESPWYNVPLSTGKPYYNSLNYYDYEDGAGEVLSNEIVYPIIQDGEVLGCVGFDTRFDESALGFLAEMEIEDNRRVMLISHDGMIMYSSNAGECRTNIADYPFDCLDDIQLAMTARESLSEEGYSPFFDKTSLLCLYPIEIENDIARPYFYMDIPMDVLHADADQTTRMIIFAGIACLILAVVILFVIAGNIVRPIRNITEIANKIAEGDTDSTSDLYVIEENSKSNNEVHILGTAIKKMLSQISGTQKLKLETLELMHKKEKAEANAQAKGDFLARMSHEIRTPMNAIVGITELVLREDISPNIQEHIMSIKNAGNNLLSIINDILDISKIESGKMEIVPAAYIFASLINDVINIIRIRTAEKPVYFVVNLDSAIPNNLIGDEVRVRQILLNLLSNAVKYTNEGFISMTIDGEVCDDDTVMLSIEVSDSGIGIRSEDMNKLFMDFVQVDMISHKGVQGTGLGLAIARSLCLAMGGDISVYSEYGQGSTFTVQLPQKFSEYEKFASVENPHEKKVLLYEPRKIYADSIACSIDNLGVECVLVQDEERFHDALKNADYPFVFVSSFLFENAKKIISQVGADPSLVLLAEYGEAIAEKNIKTIAMPVHSISIANILNDITDIAGYGGSESAGITFTAPTASVLIVDDIPTNLKVAVGLMAPYNMQIDTCLSGKAAIEMVRTTAYDIIFMDHMMPEMDGIEATQRIRALDGINTSVPIIALTANAMFGAREMFIQNGMNDFLAKPIETSKLNSVLEQWIPRDKKENQTIRRIKHTQAPFLIEGLDVNAGLTATGGDTGHYITTLSLLCSDIREKLSQIRDCMENNDIKLYITYVHALKSALLSIGAQELSSLAGNLEMAGRNEDMDFINRSTDDFLQKLEELLNNTNLAVTRIRKNNSSDEIIEKSLLIRLKNALDEIDAVTTDNIIKELQSKNWNEELHAAIEKINQNILLFEYDEAQAVIDSLIIQQEE